MKDEMDNVQLWTYFNYVLCCRSAYSNGAASYASIKMLGTTRAREELQQIQKLVVLSLESTER